MTSGQNVALVIDDEESMRDSCRQVLERAGWRVYTAPDGTEGYRLYHEHTPDVVFIDLKLPGVEGMEVLSRISQEDPAVATVVITGYATVESAVEAMKHGAYDFLPKPFTPAELRVVAWRNLEKRDLTLRNRRLQAEKDRMQENFVTLVSHEMRAPLAAAGQYLEILLEGIVGEINDKQREILEKMRGRINWLMALVKEWLSVSRLQGKTLLLDNIGRVRIAEVFEEARELVAPQADESRIQMTISTPHDIPEIEGDREALVHVFMNLLNNAVKYNNPNGKVDVTAHAHAGEMVVSVQDNGWGIPPECLPFIFDDFYRVRTQETPKTTGTGLGLSLVKKLVEAHRGRVTVTSTPGQGSNFCVYLPLKQPHVADGQEP